MMGHQTKELTCLSGSWFIDPGQAGDFLVLFAGWTGMGSPGTSLFIAVEPGGGDICAGQFLF